MVRKILLSVAFFLIATVGLMAQTGGVKGKIVDNGNEALIGANVVVKGTTIGTITDVDGNYIIQNIPAGEITLLASFIGYNPQELIVTIKAGTTSTVDFKLEEAVTALEELVVIGYGTVKKEDATGSVIAIKSDDFNKGALATPDQLITGKVAGVQITSGGGAPGSGNTIRIRGGASLNATNDPLIVIDGVPVDNRGIDGLANPLSTINPNDIESMTVLKDASAAAIYGSRASNGVIIITTKKGRSGSKLKVEYQGNVSIYTLTKTVDVLNGDEFREAVTDYANSEFSSNPDQVTKHLGTANTDWQKEIFTNAIGHEHNVNLSGSYKTLPYRFSLGYFGQDGILKTGELKRTSASVNLNPTFFDEHLKVNVNAKGSLNHSRFADEGAIGAAIQMDPTKPVYVNDTLWYWGFEAGSPRGQATSNPVARLELTDDQSDVKRFIGNVQLDYKFHFMPDLKANLNLGYDGSSSEGEKTVDSTASWAYSTVNGSGTYTNYTQDKKNKLLDFYLQYDKDFDAIDSHFDIMMGYSYQNFYKTSWSITHSLTNGKYNNPDTTTYPKNWPTEYVLLSYFGRMNYHFKDRYLLTATIRNDYSSHFSKENRSGWFPAVALAWNIKKEAFLSDMDLFSQLKLRAGWGVTGQQDLDGKDYPYQAIYSLSRPNATYLMGNTFYEAYRPGAYDENLKWEETTTLNLGFDYGFMSDKVYGSIDIYKKKSIDLINYIPIPAGTNFSNYVTTNIGDMENKGVEFSIVGRPISQKDLFWEIGFNCTYNKSEITKLTAYDDPNYLGVYTGGISGGVGSNIQIYSVGHSPNSFFVYEQVYDKNGKPVQGVYVDRDKDGKITEGDKYHYQKPAADFWFGLNSKVDYKNFSFSFSGRAQFNNYVYNNVSSNNGEYSRLFRPEGPYLANITADAKDAGFLKPQYFSDYYVKNASFFKMDNVTLSYRFDNLMDSKINATLSAMVNNAFTITKYKGLDPEISNGIDNNIYPRPRIFMFGVNLQF